MSFSGGLASLGLIVKKSLGRHALSTIVTVGSTALASGLVMAVVAISHQSREAFTGGPVGYDAVLGARGSKLQLVLNTVFHLETSPGNVPWSLYEEIAADPRVALAIPYAVGDNYEGFRIVGTTAEIFTAFEYEEGKRFVLRDPGRPFESQYRQAVIGSTVAQETGLALGSKFNPYHGVNFDPAAQHTEEYVVCGVLEPTNTPSDRVIWIPLEGIFRMEGHELRASGETFVATKGREIPDVHKEVSAIMLKLQGRGAGFQLSQMINLQGKVATLAWPISESLAQFFDQLGWIVDILGLVAVLVALVAAGSILASIYNAMNERRREFAILRALGARRRTVFSAIVLEAATIALLGSLVGFAVYAAVFATAAALVRAQTGVVLDAFVLHPVLWITPLGMVALGALAGLLPARKAYATDVASTLARS